MAKISTVILAAAALAAAVSARAHVLGGGGRAAPSTGASTSSGGTSSSSNDAWNKLDPPPSDKKAGQPGKLDQQNAAIAAQLKVMQARCDAMDQSLRASCAGEVAATAAALGGASDALAAANAPPPETAGPPTKLDQERETEAARLKAERAGCDGQDGARREACYDKMQEEHEKWHEKHEPMQSLRELADFKKLREARAKCLKLADPKKRQQCLKGLVKKKLQPAASAH
jgi:hypothetical protein